MADFDDFFSGLKDNLIDFAKDNLEEYKDELVSDGKSYLENIKEDLYGWTKALTNGELDLDEFTWLS